MLTLMQPGHTRALGENVQKININARLDLESAESQYYKIGIKKKKHEWDTPSFYCRSPVRNAFNSHFK